MQDEGVAILVRIGKLFGDHVRLGLFAGYARLQVANRHHPMRVAISQNVVRDTPPGRLLSSDDPKRAALVGGYYLVEKAKARAVTPDRPGGRHSAECPFLLHPVQN
jgi:hypothetical protein